MFQSVLKLHKHKPIHDQKHPDLCVQVDEKVRRTTQKILLVEQTSIYNKQCHNKPNTKKAMLLLHNMPAIVLASKAKPTNLGITATEYHAPHCPQFYQMSQPSE
jgi:hypothetical protein